MDNDLDSAWEVNYDVPVPKHIPFPLILDSPELLNELVMFVFFLFGAAMQFLHIYRTVWWTPDSHKNQTINYYLIESYLVVFTAVMLSRRLLYCLIIKCLDMVPNKKNLQLYKQIAKYTFGTLILSILALCAVQLYAKRGFTLIGVLIYPFVLYLLVFGFQIEPFFRTSCEVQGFYFEGVPMHNCSTTPSTIRGEVDALKNDFNNRIKHIIFTSLANTYYGCYIPCVFAQKTIYYDSYWTTQHILFIWLGGFAMCAEFNFSATYCDILHRAALHLGMWCRIDPTDLTDVQPATWSKSVAWGDESIVRYAGDIYESFGIMTTALPGNSSHSRFYKLFLNPSEFFMKLSAAQMIQVVLQIIILLFAEEWYHILSLSFLALTNHYTLFKLFRDYLMTKTIYAAETAGHEKGGHYH